MKDSGWMTCKKVLERRHGRIAQYTKASTVKVISMGVECMCGVMAQHMMENGSQVRFMDKELTHGLMDASTLANGRRTKCMDLDR